MAQADSRFHTVEARRLRISSSPHNMKLRYVSARPSCHSLLPWVYINTIHLPRHAQNVLQCTSSADQPACQDYGGEKLSPIFLDKDPHVQADSKNTRAKNVFDGYY